MPDTTDTASSTRIRRLALAAAAAVVLAVILALTQPWLLLVDEVADDTLPVIASTPDVMDDETSAPSTPMDQGTPDEDMSDPADGDATGEGSSSEGSMSDAPMATEPVGPVVISRGMFISRDHETTGDVAIVQLEDGRRVLTIEDLSTSNGPDLFVYLDDNPADAEALAFDDGLDLGPLRGNVGDLVYEIPPEADLTDLDTVVIWCDRFSHVFGAADLLPV